MADPTIVYAVASPGGLEAVWTTPEAALDELDKHSSGRAYVAVRELNATCPTPASIAAQEVLRQLMKARHEVKTAQRKQNG